MRSQYASASTRPARVNGVAGCASLRRHVLYVESPRPGERPVRRSPTMHRLYLMAGMPVAAQLRIRVWRSSMSRSRCGTLGQHDGGMFLAIDMARCEERRRNAVDSDVMALRQIPHPLELIGRSVQAAIGDFGIAADSLNAVAFQVLQVLLVGRRALTAESHERRWRRCCRRGRNTPSAQRPRIPMKGNPGDSFQPPAGEFYQRQGLCCLATSSRRTVMPPHPAGFGSWI